MGIEAKTVVQGVRPTQSYKDIVEGENPKKDLQDSLDAMRYNEKNSDIAYEEKVAVLSINRMQVEKYIYIVISGYPQAENESNTFDTDVLHAYASACDSLKGNIFITIYVNEFSCDFKWVQENICNFLRGHCQHVGITDTNLNAKNNWYQNLG